MENKYKEYLITPVAAILIEHVKDYEDKVYVVNSPEYRECAIIRISDKKGGGRVVILTLGAWATERARFPCFSSPF